MSKERQFKGLSLSERKEARRENSLKPVLQLMEPLAFSVTVKDVCQEAKLTERYFMNHLKRVKIYSRLSFKMIEELQQNLMQAVIKAAPDPEQMVDAGLRALLSTLKTTLVWLVLCMSMQFWSKNYIIRPPFRKLSPSLIV